MLLASDLPTLYKDFFYEGGPYNGQRHIRPAEMQHETVAVPTRATARLYFDYSPLQQLFGVTKYNYSRVYGGSPKRKIVMKLVEYEVW